VLVKYTYYGDTNLDGKVDGSDYSRIDASYAAETPGHPISGWLSGDFNYDDVVDGSDYTLIDNTFNIEGAQLTATIASIASPTAQIASTAAVPEPAAMSMLGITALGLLRRRRATRS
jgi:hypothetical protein